MAASLVSSATSGIDVNAVAGYNRANRANHQATSPAAAPSPVALPPLATKASLPAATASPTQQQQSLSPGSPLRTMPADEVASRVVQGYARGHQMVMSPSGHWRTSDSGVGDAVPLQLPPLSPTRGPPPAATSSSRSLQDAKRLPMRQSQQGINPSSVPHLGPLSSGANQSPPRSTYPPPSRSQSSSGFAAEPVAAGVSPPRVSKGGVALTALADAAEAKRLPTRLSMNGKAPNYLGEALAEPSGSSGSLQALAAQLQGMPRVDVDRMKDPDERREYMRKIALRQQKDGVATVARAFTLASVEGSEAWKPTVKRSRSLTKPVVGAAAPVPPTGAAPPAAVKA